jgi:uncharacterized membrane protein YidH (DUF202 family)
MINLLIILSNTLFQQDVEMADLMRQDGKIWVVVGVILIVFTGIILFLISLDKKVTKLEKNNK